MPTPIGHAIGGFATACFSDVFNRKITRLMPSPSFPAMAAACAAAAVAPDLDILFHSHRTYAHSIGAAFLAGVVAWWLVRRRGSRPVWFAVTIAAAYGSHLLLDWLAKDSAPPFGLMALWPFSSRFYLSGADLFMKVSRRYWKPGEFIVGNLEAAGWEVLVLAPIAALAFWLHRRPSIGDRQ